MIRNILCTIALAAARTCYTAVTAPVIRYYADVSVVPETYSALTVRQKHYVFNDTII